MSSTNIQIAVRARPLIEREENDKLKASWEVKENSIVQIDSIGNPIGEYYHFDHIFNENSSNKDVYDKVVKPLVLSCVEGINSTIFAYGQTSSGKTHTMLGTKTIPGIINFVINDVFKHLDENPSKNFLLRCSCLEIYNEKIYDLLDMNATDLKIREDIRQGVYVSAKEEVVQTPDELLSLILRGMKTRRIECTDLNERSSRSHAIFKLVIQSQCRDSEGSYTESSLCLVDLAGSERVGQMNLGRDRQVEGVSINKSLTTLGLVIRKLSENDSYINYRDSKLTRLLQQSLGGNSRTLIIATVTVATAEETKSTLDFAQRAKCVKNRPIINKKVTDKDQLKIYESLCEDYKTQIEKLKEDRIIKEETINKLEGKISNIRLFTEGNIENSSYTLKIPSRRHTLAIPKYKTGKAQVDFGMLDNSELDVYKQVSLLSSRFSLIQEEKESFQESQTLQSPKTPMSKLRFEKEQLEQSLETLREFTNVEKYFQTDHGRLEELNDVLIRVQEENVALRNENIELRNYQLNIIPVVLEMQNQLYELRDILQEEEILHSRSHLNTIMEEDDAVLKLKEDISEKDETIKTLKTKLKQERETKETELEMLNARIVKFNDYKEEMHKQISQLQSIRSENDELQMLSRENNQLKLNLEKTLNELHDVKAELRKKSNEIDKLTNELDDVRFELSGEQKEVENVYLKLEQLQKQKDDELEKVTIEAVKLKTSLDENNAKLTAILHEKEVLESNLNKEISRFTATQEEKTIEMETLLKTKVSAIDELKMKLVQTEEEFTKEISNLQIERKTLKEEMTEVNTLHKIAIEDLESLLKSRDIEISELKRTLDSQVDQSKLEEEIKTLQAVNRKAKEDLDSLKKSYDYQLKLAVNFNQNEEKFQLERSKLEEEINTLKLLNKKANENLQCLKESKDIEISELKQILSSKQEEMKFELERNKLNEEIETLKAVNRKVKEDLDSLKKSYDFQLKLAHNFNQNEEKFQLERIKLEEEINTLKLLNKKVNEDLQCLKESKDIEISELKRILPSKQETMKFELERNKLNEEIMTLKVVNRKMKEDLDSLKKSYDFQLKLALNFNQKEEKFQLERTKLEEKMNTLKLLNKKANEDLQSLKESQVIEISELKRTLSSKQEELKFELEQNKLKDEIHTLKTLNLQLTEQLESLKSNLMNRDLEISELKREKTTEIHELTTQLKELKDKSNRKSGISDSMTKLLNHQMELQCLTKDNEDLKRQLDFLLRLPLNSDRLPHKSDSQDLWLLSDKSKDRIPELKKFQEFIETKCQEITTLTRVQDSLKIKIKKLEDLLKKKEEELTDLRKETDRCNRVGKIGLFTSIKGSGTEKNKIVQLKADGGFQYEPTFRNQPNKVKKTKEKSSQPRSVFSLNFGSTYSSSEEEDNGNIQNQKLDMLTNENKQLKQELARLTSIVDKPTVDNVNTHDHERPSSRLSDGKSISPNHLRRIKRQSLIDQRRGLSPDLINMFDNQESEHILSGSNNEHLEKSTNTVSVCTIDQSTQATCELEEKYKMYRKLAIFRKKEGDYLRCQLNLPLNCPVLPLNEQFKI